MADVRHEGTALHAPFLPDVRVHFHRLRVGISGLPHRSVPVKDLGGTRQWQVLSAVVFGAIIAAFDTGIGTGSLVTGWLIQHDGFRTAFGVGAAISALAIP